MSKRQSLRRFAALGRTGLGCLILLIWISPTIRKPAGGDTLGARYMHQLGDWNLLRLLDHLLRHRGKTIAVTVLLFPGSIALLAFNPARLLPLLDEDSLLLSYGLAPGSSLTESNRVGDDLEQRLLALPGVKAVFRRSGSPASSFYIERPNEGELVVLLERTQAPDIQALKARLDALLAATPGVIGRVNEPTTEKLDESFSGLPALFGITLYGNALQPLYAAAARVEGAARKVPGVTNVINNTKVPVDQLRIDLDRTALARFDVTAKAAAQAVRLAMQGEVDCCVPAAGCYGCCSPRCCWSMASSPCSSAVSSIPPWYWSSCRWTLWGPRWRCSSPGNSWI